MSRSISFLLLLCLLFLGTGSYAQEISIQLGPDEIALNQPFTITVTIQNDRLKNYEDFPEIPGFRKRGTTSSTNTNIVNGQISSAQSIIQNYIALREGTFQIKPFQMEVNGKLVRSGGKTVKVGPAQQRKRRDPFGNSLFDEFFGKSSEPEEFVNVKADAFLALTTDRNEVYVGEGFTATLAFYVSESNRAHLEFYDLSRQVSDVTKKISPPNSWEENFNIENINGETVVLNNKRYTRFKLYQAAFYPLNTEPIEFPTVSLELIKYQIAKNPTFFGRNKKEDFQTFHSKPKRIRVKDLPPHPMKDRVPVGDYYLDEKISTENIETGQSFNLQFGVYGEGNIAAISKPEVESTDEFELYPPNIQQNIKRGNGRVTGYKAFNFYGIPNEPGEYNLGGYFNLIFFNPKIKKYDTLSSNITINVTGESKKNQYISSNDLGTFYDLIEGQDNTLVSRSKDVYLKFFANIFILIMLALSLFLIFRK
ncbi:BatD family protein [Fulvivirgaceae bacterium BMA10]|uniref:BatD family protein n=1 Tax=Splendidivirga corallicola TaxID=3051826 RepID=A0ABT8KIN9_9BACT|nr:BatD family protein [Fulvivirgaceae bacterium BMA10]